MNKSPGNYGQQRLGSGTKDLASTRTWDKFDYPERLKGVVSPDHEEYRTTPGIEPSTS